ncbi:hypothetical protein [Actinoplanes sp. M2I2]|uniref:hypothetical protein n=1 Tax=Actinoplanes sp. M2I2 TaxID=1734444 RepID=UPI002021293E|nr:hypothetical protein [Actinoplanes sp. M2I2]
MRELYEDEYSPEFSSILIRDAVTDGPEHLIRAPLLGEDAGPMWGTVGRAGDGWLQLNALSGFHRVRLEAHDAAPPPEPEPWRDVFEMPYHCGSGRVGLTTTTNGSPYSGLELGPPGFYRVRVCRRPADDEGDIWVARFWPEAVRLPRWLIRGPLEWGGEVAEDVYAVVSWTPDGRLETTVDELAEALQLSASAIVTALPGEHLLVEHTNEMVILTGVSDELPEPDAPVEAEPREPSAEDLEFHAVIERHQEERRLAGIRRRPPAGAPPRPGYVNTDIVVWRDDRYVTVSPCPINDPFTACEVAGGVVVAGDHIVELTRHERAAYVKWDGSVVELGPLRADFKVSPDGTVLAAHELGRGRRGVNRLHLIDLPTGTRHALPIDSNVDLRISGVSTDTVWFRPNVAYPDEMCWTAGDAAPRPARERAPVSGWEGPLAPPHWHYAAYDCGRSFSAQERITVQDSGESRTYRTPEPSVVDHRVRPVWEDPDHLLLTTGLTINGGGEFLTCVFRLDVGTGAFETAATDTHVKTFIWPWPQVGHA